MKVLRNAADMLIAGVGMQRLLQVALDEAGLFKESEKFYDWALKTQDSEGFWHQRYHMNGNLAPSIGIQIDETGSIIFGMWQHFLHVKSMHFLEKVWPYVYKAAKFLLKGLLTVILDCRYHPLTLGRENGEHTYSTAAVVAGFYAAANIAGSWVLKHKSLSVA